MKVALQARPQAQMDFYHRFIVPASLSNSEQSSHAVSPLGRIVPPVSGFPAGLSRDSMASMARFKSLGRLFLALSVSTATIAHADEPLIGYSELRTDLPGGRHANISTMRAMVVATNGNGCRELAPDLATPKDTWTQFASWSPDGTIAIIGNG